MKTTFESIDKAIYTGVKIKDMTHVVTDKDVDNQMQRFLQKNTHLKMKDGIAVIGDVANIDYEGFKDGVPFKGGKGSNFNLTLGSNTFIPGFETQLCGHKAGEEVDVKLSFPERYQEPSLAGQPVVFKVKINSVGHPEMPKLDDEFAKTMGEENVESFREAVRTEMKKMAAYKEMERRRSELLRIVDKNAGAAAEPSDEMMAEVKADMLAELEVRLQLQNQTLDFYLRANRATRETLDQNLSRQARPAARVRGMLMTIAAQEDLMPTDEDVDKFFEGIAKEGKGRKTLDEIRTIFPREIAVTNIAMDKANRFIADHAVLEANA